MFETISILFQIAWSTYASYAMGEATFLRLTSGLFKTFSVQFCHFCLVTHFSSNGHILLYGRNDAKSKNTWYNYIFNQQTIQCP